MSATLLGEGVNRGHTLDIGPLSLLDVALLTDGARTHYEMSLEPDQFAAFQKRWAEAPPRRQDVERRDRFERVRHLGKYSGPMAVQAEASPARLQEPQAA